MRWAAGEDGSGGGGVESRGVFFCCLDLFERAGGGGVAQI